MYAGTDGGVFKSTDGGGSWQAVNSGLTELWSPALALGPDDEPVWLCVQPIGERWAAMLVADGVTRPGADELKGLAFFGDTAEEAEQVAKAYLG